MVFVPAPQTAETVIKHTAFVDPAYNVLNWFRDTPISQADLDALATAMVSAWTTAIMPVLSVAITLDEVVARDLSVQDGLQASATPAVPVFGGVGGDCLPASVAYCMTHRTARIGRSRRGRTFFTGIAEASANGNNASTDLRDTLTVGFNAVKTAMLALGWQFVIVSRIAEGVPRGTALTTVVTQSVFRDLRLDSQRGRMPG